MMNSTLMYTMDEVYSFFAASLQVATAEIDPPVDFMAEAYEEDFRTAFLSSLKEEERSRYTVDQNTLTVTYLGTVSSEDLEDYPCAAVGEVILHVSCDLSSPELGDWEVNATTTGTIGNWYIPF